MKAKPDGFNVAVVGATGAVGRTMLEILTSRAFPVAELRLIASSRSAGSQVDTPWGRITIEDLAEVNPTGIDIALFSAGADRSRAYAPAFAAAGAVVIDNSSAFRQDPHIPLVVAGVNDHAALAHEGIIANPNCTTMVALMGVAPLARAAGLRRLAATSYQSVSGSGMAGMDELADQVAWFQKDRDALVFGGWEEPEVDVYARPIGWNVLPLAGDMAEDGHTVEEWKLVHESRKILGLPDLAVEPACVRVPVMVGHGIAASCYFDRPMEVDEASELIRSAKGVLLWEDKVATPLDSAGIDDVLVSRVRPTLAEPGGISLWAVGDNLRKGAALNTIEIAELLTSG